MRLIVDIPDDIAIERLTDALRALDLPRVRYDARTNTLHARRPVRAPVTQLSELRRLLRGPGSAPSPVSPKGSA